MRRFLKCLCTAGIAMATTAPAARAAPAIKTQSFDRDPGWDRSNNRPADRGDRPVTIRQDFGYSATSHAGARSGEIGGFLQAAAEPAWYGKPLAGASLDRPLSASGMIAMADGRTHLLLGFFNSHTAKEWRTANTLALRLNGRGDRIFAYLEYCTSKWRAGGDHPQFFPVRVDPATGRKSPQGFPQGLKVHHWELRYDPAGNEAGGAITASIDGQSSGCHLIAGHKADGATFDRFGLLDVMKSADGGCEVYVGDLTINGERQPLDADPHWDGHQNRTTWTTTNVRPHFDFGFSPTHFAGGAAGGEMGGLFFRGDCRYPQRMAFYADKVGPLTADKPLHASGRVALRRGVTDSTTLFGFFNAAAAMRSNPAQDQSIPEGVVGVNVEGPSSEGFCFYPVARSPGANGLVSPDLRTVHILPDGAAHGWAFDYDPAGAAGRGTLTVTLDGKSAHLDLDEGTKARGVPFDHFGLVTPWIDGNGQDVYFDDVTYSVAQ